MHLKPQNRIKWLWRLLGITCLIYLANWVLQGGQDLGERAGFAQAVLAGVLIWATWNAIDKSDAQIDKAQSQIDLSQRTLDIELTPNIIITQPEIGFDLKLTNIGKYPIYIKQTHLYPLIDLMDNIMDIVLEPLKSIHFKTPISPYYPNLIENDNEDEYELSIEMYYNGNNGMVWVQSFLLKRETFDYKGETVAQWLFIPTQLEQREDHLVFDFNKQGT